MTLLQDGCRFLSCLYGFKTRLVRLYFVSWIYYSILYRVFLLFIRISIEPDLDIQDLILDTNRQQVRTALRCMIDPYQKS